MGVQSVSYSGASELARERCNHVGSVDSVPGVWSNAVYGGSVGDLGELGPDIDGDGLDNWSRHIFRPNKRSNNYPCQLYQETRHC